MPPPKKPKVSTRKTFFLDLSDDQMAKVQHDVQVAKHICVTILKHMADQDGETMKLLHLAFGLNVKNHKQSSTIQSFYRRCADELEKMVFKLDGSISGVCVSEGFSACFVSTMKNTIVVSNVEDVADYFAQDPLTRATTLIHEFAHVIGVDSKDHPGGVWIAEIPPSDGKPRIAFADASHNAHCYGNFAYWVARADKILEQP